MILDILSAEYGWTTEYILSRTFREIHIRMDRIVKRKDQDWKIWASLHGIQMKDKATPTAGLSDKQRAAIDRFHGKRIMKLDERAKEWQRTR